MKGVPGRTWKSAMGPETLGHCLGVSERALMVSPSLQIVFEGWGMEEQGLFPCPLPQLDAEWGFGSSDLSLYCSIMIGSLVIVQFDYGSHPFPPFPDSPPAYYMWLCHHHCCGPPPNSVGLLLFSLMICFVAEPLLILSPLPPGPQSML